MLWLCRRRRGKWFFDVLDQNSYRRGRERCLCLVSLCVFLYIMMRVELKRSGDEADVARTRDESREHLSDVDNGVGADLSNRKRS
jgi:hypothetical protein